MRQTKNNNYNTWQQTLKKAYGILSAANVPTPYLDAELLLCCVLHVLKEKLFAYPERRCTPTQYRRFFYKIAARARRMPVAYLTNSKEFFHRTFFVSRSVLIPRPETETLITQALRYDFSSVADIGTGSGAIAVTLKKERPRATVFATDISRRALTVAQKNARHNAADVTFFAGDLLRALPQPVDMLIANLPYLPNAFPLPPESLYEPRRALYGGPTGNELIARFLRNLARFPWQPHMTLLEIYPKTFEKLQTEFSSIFTIRAFGQKNFVTVQKK